GGLLRLPRDLGALSAFTESFRENTESSPPNTESSGRREKPFTPSLSSSLRKKNVRRSFFRRGRSEADSRGDLGPGLPRAQESAQAPTPQTLGDGPPRRGPGKGHGGARNRETRNPERSRLGNSETSP